MRPEAGKRVTLTACFLCLLTQVASAHHGIADHVIVNKTERRLYLMDGKEILSEYPIALGLFPKGHKQQEGDFRTPEGDYLLTRRLVDSDYFMAIEINYPNSTDAERARELGVSPGGSIMIHGQPVNPTKSPRYYEKYDWTNGCIAVSNQAMTEIWQLTIANTPITILP